MGWVGRVGEIVLSTRPREKWGFPAVRLFRIGPQPSRANRACREYCEKMAARQPRAFRAGSYYNIKLMSGLIRASMTQQFK
jgi:hypothetical protein